MYKNYPFSEIKDELKKNLNDKRYRHVLQVAEAARLLAERYGINQDKTMLAALFHDFAKGMNSEKSASYIQRYSINFDDLEIASSELMHGRIARYIAFFEYGIWDADILNAIEFHTTGRKDMSFFEMIIVLADYIEEGRNFPGVEKIRELAPKNPVQALLIAMDGTLIHLIEEGKTVHPRSIEARNYLLDIKRNDEVMKI